MATAFPDAQTRTRVYFPLWRTVFLTALLTWLYLPTLSRLFAQWMEDSDYSHGFFVPLFSFYVVWQRRVQLSQLLPQPSWAGLPLLAFAMSVLILGQLGAELFLARFSLLLTAAGVIVLFLGWSHFRAVLFPWAFLFLMIPIPAIIFNQITFALQLVASRVAAATLALFGIPILQEGNLIHLPTLTLEVAEACSGIRSLVTLLTLAIIYGYLMDRRLWVRWLLAVSSIPIAVVANSTRIIGTGILVQYWGAARAQGYLHALWGWIVFLVSLMLLYALQRLTRLTVPRHYAQKQNPQKRIMES